MGRWWKSGQISKLGLVSRETLAAGSVAALLLVAACGDDADKAAGENALETVAAVAIDPAQAPIIQKATEEYLQLAAGNAEQRVIHFSAVKVTPGSDAFDVAIENLVVGVKIGDQWADSRLEVGTVSYRLVPTAGNGYRASDLKHATEMPVLDKDNKKTGTFGMTTKAFSADWSTDIGNVLSLDWQAANIAVSPFDAAGAPDTKAGGLQIATVNWNTTSADKGNGVYDQISTFSTGDFVIKTSDGVTVKIGKVSGSGGYTDIKLKEAAAKGREVQKLMSDMAERSEAAKQAAAAATDPANPPAAAPMSPEEAKQMGDMIKSIAGLFGGFSYNVALENLHTTDLSGAEPFSLAKVGFAMGVASLNTEKATGNLGFSHDGLKINSPKLNQLPLFAKLLPASGKLDLNLADVPSKELWQLLGDNFPTLVSSNPAQAEAAAGVMFIAMQQLLQKAPMKLTVAPSGLSSEVLQLDATGAFDVKPDAVFGLVGALDIGLHGLDEAMKLANEAAQSSPDAAQIVGGLAMIQSMAKREDGSDGKPVDKLKLEVDATGNTMVNGMPMSGQ